MTVFLLNAKDQKKQSELGKLQYQKLTLDTIVSQINNTSSGYGETSVTYEWHDKKELITIFNRLKFFKDLGYDVKFTRSHINVSDNTTVDVLNEDNINNSLFECTISWE